MRPCESYLHTGALWYSYLHPKTPTYTLGLCDTLTSTLRPQDSYLHTETRDNSIFTLTPGETPSCTMRHHASYMHTTRCDTPPACWDPVTLTCALSPCDTHACTLKSHDSYLHTGTSRYSCMHTETPTLLPVHWTLRYSSLNNETSEPLPAYWDHVIHIPASWDFWLLLERWDLGIPTCTLDPDIILPPHRDPRTHTCILGPCVWYSYPHNETPWLVPANWDPTMMLLPTHWDCMTPTCTLEPCDTPTCTLRLPDSYLHMTGTLWCTLRPLDSYPHTETPKYSYLNIGTPGHLPAHWDLVIPLSPHWNPMILLTCTMTPSDSNLCTTSCFTPTFHIEAQWDTHLHIETLWVSPAH